MANKDTTPTADETPKTPEAAPPATPEPTNDLAAQQAALDARKAELDDREEAANAVLRKAEEVSASIDEKASAFSASVERAQNQQGDALKQNNAEKARVVADLHERAYPNRDLGELKEYIPRVTLTTVSPAGDIVYEKGVPYMVPNLIRDDLLRRETENTEYQEKTHIREEISLNAGRISGGGK